MKTMTSHSSRSNSKSKLILPDSPKIVRPKSNLILPDSHKTARPKFDELIRHGNLDGEFKFLTYAGILPMDMPDGTKIAILPDIHVPAHDHMVLWAVKLALRDYAPDILIFIGDVADCFAISAWPADPSVRRDIQAELDETREVIDELRKVSGAKWTFVIMGNHEDRIWRYLTNVAPHLANIINPVTREKSISIHDLLNYGPDDNITFIYDTAERGGFGGGILANGHFKWHHGIIVRPKPAASPRADADNSGTSTQHGHTHRVGFALRETTHGEVMGSEIGHLIDENHPYVAYSALRNNHHQAIAFASVVGGKVHPETYPIVAMEVEGKLRKVLAIGDRTYLASDR